MVRGEIVSVEPGRAFGAPGKELHYAAAALRVDDLIAGSISAADATQLTVEIPLYDGPDSISRLPDWGQAVFVLRNKGTSARESGLDAERQAEEARYYRLVSFGSLVVDDAGVAVTDPDAPLLADLDGKPFERVVERLASIGR